MPNQFILTLQGHCILILFDFETVARREFSHTCCAICLLKGLLLLHFQLFGLIIRFAF